MSVAVRLVLALLLVLNGIGTAAAAARMALEGGHSAVAVATTAAEHCAPSMDAMPAAAHHGDHATTATERCGDHAKPDCCGSSACDCACAQGASTLVFEFLSAMPPFPRAVIPPAPSPAHAAPALPTPIRPPIA
ncbi:CopL family metal-binding regulatory protein [Dokdonella sp.]|uniref:CopL family metal-binding regulatory protein n=1 Tax=Dokdonella sp. TaxID=2291710 RepID=UPI00260E667A|nr:CopL family metal-binding regulatory protein [Dokdonella sp.]